MNIAIVVNDLCIRGGTQKQVLRLAEYLKNQGQNLEILTYNYDPTSFYHGIEEFNVKYLSYGKENIGSKVRILKIVQRFINAINLFKLLNSNIDILNIHDNGCSFIIILTKLLRRKVKIVWQINDLPGAFRVGPAARNKGLLHYPIRRLYYKFIARLVDRITVNVSKNKRRIKEAMGVDSEVFYCGVDVSDSALIERKINSKVRLLSIGVFYTYRNYEAILDAMSYLKKDRKIESELTIVGSTEREPDYAEKIRRMAIDNDLTVNIMGEISDNVLKNKYYDTDIFLFVNIDQSWGLAVFEAMTYSLPVIVSESVGAVEILDSDKGVIIVNPTESKEIANAIESLCKNGNQYTSFSKNAYNYAISLTWDNLYCNKMLNLFSGLIPRSLPR